MVAATRKAIHSLNTHTSFGGMSVVHRVWCRTAVAFALLTIACAGRVRPPTASCPRNESCDAHLRLGEPNPKVASLLAAAGNDAVALAIVHPDAWTGLQTMLAKLEVYREIAKEQPWLASKDLLGALQSLIGSLPEDSRASMPALAGWDPTRPVVLALVDSTSGNAIEQINATVFDRANLPVHVRILIPATNAPALVGTLKTTLSRLFHDEGTAGRHLLEWKDTSCLAAASIAARDYVRLEFLFFPHNSKQDWDKAAMLSQLERETAVPRPRGLNRAPGPIDRLLASSHGVALGFRPTALAHRLTLDSPTKMMAALFGVESRVKTRILAEGLSEILSGYLLVTAEQPEIAELGVAANFDKGIQVASLAQLTPTGRKNMSVMIDPDGVALAPSANTLASFTVAFSKGNDVRKVEPFISVHSDKTQSRGFFHRIQDAGSSAWPALWASPVAVWRNLLAEAPSSDAIGNVTSLPQDVSFDLLDFDDEGEPKYCWRAHLPLHGDPTATWWNIAQMLAKATDRDGKKELRQDQAADGTWITWTHGLEPHDTFTPSRNRSALPKGTFAVSAVNATKIADRLERTVPKLKQRAPWMFQLLRQLDHMESSTRLQGNWLIGEMKGGSSGWESPHVFQSPLPTPRFEESKSSPANESLRQAIAKTSDFLKYSVDVSATEVGIADGRAELQDSLEQAMRDPATRADAAALDRALLRLEKMFRESRVKLPKVVVPFREPQEATPDNPSEE